MERIKAVVDLQGIHGGSISCAVVATFCIQELETGAWIGKTPLITSA